MMDTQPLTPRQAVAFCLVAPMIVWAVIGMALLP